jgi:general stress protein YciG
MATKAGSKSKQGFASMSEEKQRAIARKGGESVPKEKRSFSQNRGLAAEAGRKGGEAVPSEKRSFSQNRELAAEAGRKGGESVPDEKRSFSKDRQLAAEAGRKGGESRNAHAAPPRTVR